MTLLLRRRRVNLGIICENYAQLSLWFCEPKVAKVFSVRSVISVVFNVLEGWGRVKERYEVTRTIGNKRATLHGAWTPACIAIAK